MALNKKLILEISAVNGETGEWIYSTLILSVFEIQQNHEQMGGMQM